MFPSPHKTLATPWSSPTLRNISRLSSKSARAPGQVLVRGPRKHEGEAQVVQVHEDLVGGLGPDEWMAAIVPAVDEPEDRLGETPARSWMSLAGWPGA